MASPSGAKVWIYRFRDPAGKMAQLLIGSLPALSLADARSEWRNHRANRDKHGDPCDEVRRRQEAAKVAAIVPMRKRAPRVAAMGISALRGVIRHARSMNRLDLDVIDPTAGIPTIPQGKRSRALSDPEISLLLRWLDSGAVSRTIVDVLRLTLYTGARSGEVCAMRSRDVDIDAKTWTHTQGKTGDVSVTPLSAPAVEILRNRLGEEYVFPVRGNPVNQKALSVALFASRQAGDACPGFPASITSMPTPMRCANGWIVGRSIWRE